MIFDTEKTSIIKQFNLGQASESTDAKFTGMMHPMTYLNKLLLWGGTNMQLHNVMEDNCIFKFAERSSAIQCVE